MTDLSAVEAIQRVLDMGVPRAYAQPLAELVAADPVVRAAMTREALEQAARAVEAWASENEIAAPPLDWDGLGSILDVIAPSCRGLIEQVSE